VVELQFVWHLAADLPGMGNPNRRFLSPASTAVQVMEAHKHFHRDKVVVRENAHKNLSKPKYGAISHNNLVMVFYE